MEQTTTQYDVVRKQERRNADALQDIAFMHSLGVVDGQHIKQTVRVVDSQPVDTHKPVTTS